MTSWQARLTNRIQEMNGYIDELEAKLKFIGEQFMKQVRKRGRNGK